MADQNQNPGRKWRDVEQDGDGDKYFDHFRFTPHTTDMEFFRDPNIYETEVIRSTQEIAPGQNPESERGPRGFRRPDERIIEEIIDLMASQGQFDASDIQVHAKDGIVTLLGRVDNQDAKHMAAKYVENVLGVMGVNNDLKVNGMDR